MNSIASHLPSPVRAFADQQSRSLLLEILVMLASTAICLALYVGGSPEIMNYFAPATILVVSSFANFQMVRKDGNALLTPLFAMRLIAFVIFGIGAMSHNFLTGIVQSFDYMMVTTAEDTARVNLLWLGGLDAMLVGALAAMRLFREMRVRSTHLAAAVSFNLALSLFWMGMLGSTVLPLLLDQMPNLVTNLFLAIQLAGIFLMGRTADGKAFSIGGIVFASWALVFMSLYMMNKTVVLYPVLCLMLGFLSVKIDIKRVVLGFIVVGGLFFVIAPIVAAMRSEQMQSHGNLNDLYFAERIESVVEHVKSSGGEAEETDPITKRLDYVVPAAFAMNQYESGFQLDLIRKSGVAFIPRFLWPEKPVITTGDQVNYRMGFQYQNNIGVTMFADMYWNVGWLMLVLACLMGFYNGAITILTRELMRMEDWIMLPFVVGAFRSALNLDGEFVSGFMLLTVISFIIFVALRITAYFLASKAGLTNFA